MEDQVVVEPGSEVPADVRRFADLWQLTLVERTHTRYSQTWFAMRGESHVVLKVGDAPARQRESAALRAYQGADSADDATAGSPVACRVLAEAAGALLLERILLGDDLRPLAAVDDDAATEVAAGVYAAMHRAVAGVPRPSELPELREVAVAFDTYRARVGTAVTHPLPQNLVDRAEAALAELTVPSPDDIVLHGDAHHQNLIRDGFGGTEDTWRVIDPHGWWGDPTFDAASLMLNLHGSLEMSGRALADLRRQALRRTAILAEVAGFDRDRLLAWTFVGAIVAELWCLEDHGFVQGGPLRLAESLAASH